MANDFYQDSGSPSTSSQGSSSTMRAEFAAIEAGFDKMPALTGNGSKIIAVNSGGSGLEAITTTGTGSGVRATAPTLVTPDIGTPSAGVLTNCTGLPVSTGISGLAAGVATFLATPTSANLIAAVTNETGTGSLVFATSPTLVTPILGVAAGTSLNLGAAVVNAKLNTVASAATPALGIEVAVVADAVIMYSGISGGTSGWKLMQDELTTGDLYLKARNAGVDTLALYYKRSNGAVGVGIAPTQRFHVAGATSGAIFINDTGQLYGSALHNNVGAVTGATNQHICSGSYTPTITAVTNVAASTARLTSWKRTGNVVTVGGQCDIDPTAGAGALTQFRMSLPIASALTTSFQLGGSGAWAGGTYEAVTIFASAANDEALFNFLASGTANAEVTFSFTYEVLN